MSNTLVKCVVCGKEFPWHHGKNTCSDDCKYERKLEVARKNAEKLREKNKVYIPKKKCEFCGKEYQPINFKGRFCSDECRSGHKKKENAEKRAERKTVIRLKKRVCKLCGKEFETQFSEKYCSPECKLEVSRMRKRTFVPSQRKCVVCGAEFTTTFKSQEWCKKECQKKLYKRREQIRSDRIADHIQSFGKVDEIESKARGQGMTYGKYKAQEMIDRYARVELPEWATGEK